jgi:hypothetical protein
MSYVKPTLVIENNSGDVFVRHYENESEAETLFASSIYRSGRSLEYWPATGSWFYVWNKELSKEFECWKN